MLLRIEIHKVQHIEHLCLELDLSQNKLTGLVGRNGVGKTTLVRSLKNLSQSDTFLRTAQAGIFSKDSTIRYQVGAQEITFYFDEHLESLNCKAKIDPIFRELCSVELPIPHGNRFNYFQSVSRADRHIRRQIVLEEYTRPSELIEFLCSIYSSTKFQALIETEIDGRGYFSLLMDDGRYIREDYLSSGEYFLIDLYRMLRGAARLIVVDEIDISLDAVAQVELLKQLRQFCQRYECNVLFTTHSLAMMRTLDDRELFHMERSGVATTVRPVSYSFLKSLLFGFSGWDRYILTEDRVLKDFLQTLIRLFCPEVFFEFKIIYVGGANHVVDLLARNRIDQIFEASENVIAILDGDQRKTDWGERKDVHYLPFESVEKQLAQHYQEVSFPYKLSEGKGYSGPKDLFHSLQRDCLMSVEMINEFICRRNEKALVPICSTLRAFLAIR